MWPMFGERGTRHDGYVAHHDATGPLARRRCGAPHGPAPAGRRPAGDAATAGLLRDLGRHLAC